MPRYFAPITIPELEAKIDKAFVDADSDCIHKRDRFSAYDMVEKLGKDLKVSFDCENFDMEGKGILGYHTLPNGLTFLGCYGGGDWEHPVSFIIYWDGKRLRGYVPTEGNPYNTDTMQAFGNDEDADRKNARKRWPDCPDDLEGWFDSDDDAMLKDIEARILPQGSPKPAPKAVSRTGKKSVQERIEACTYYGTGDKGYELFQATCDYCYQLTGLGQSDKAEIVCQWAEEMAKESAEGAKQEGFLFVQGVESAESLLLSRVYDSAKGFWGRLWQ
jgi:hypothetical protein